ncbi:MAG: SAM-dependent methyltransferase [Candidatus Micrarchaeaceae archaeon]
MPMNSVFAHSFFKVLAESDINIRHISATLANLLDIEKSFAIECTLVGDALNSRKSTGIGKRDIEVGVGRLLENNNFRADLSNPDVIVLITAVAGRAYIGAVPGGSRPKPKQASYLNRAGKKFIEAYEFFGISGMKIRRALDIGAAPGGFSKAMADLGIYVAAVDPGALDQSLLHNSNIVHYRMKAENFKTDDKFDIITNDMNMHPLNSCRIVLSLSNMLTDGGALLLTVKCPTNNPFKYMEIAKNELRTVFSDFKFKHLEANRSEVMLFAKKTGSFY